jgi:two-component system, sensor histidine kinase YesM
VEALKRRFERRCIDRTNVLPLIGAMGEVKTGRLSTRLEDVPDEDFGFLSRQFNQMVTQIETLMVEVGVQHTKYQLARLKYLQAQTDPHFLFSSLYLAYQMCEANSAKTAGSLLLEMGSYYRYAANLNDPTTTIEEELRNIRSYASIYRMRYGEGIGLRENLCAAPLETRIPRLTLQPLVENSFKHGFSARPTIGLIDIAIWEQQDVVYMRVSDTGTGMNDCEIERLNESLREMTTSPDQPIGLRNTHWRLRLRYRGHAGLRVDPAPEVGFSVTGFITPEEDTYGNALDC